MVFNGWSFPCGLGTAILPSASAGVAQCETLTQIEEANSSAGAPQVSIQAANSAEQSRSPSSRGVPSMFGSPLLVGF